MVFRGQTVDADINVKVAHSEIKCPGEPFADSAGTISFTNITNTGDCMGDQLRKQKKDPSLFTLSSNDDGSLTFHSDGWPNLKLKQK